MVLAPSWLSSNRAWKAAPGACDIHRLIRIIGGRVFLGGGYFGALKSPEVREENEKHTLRERVDRGSQNTCAKFRSPSLHNGVEHFRFCADNIYARYRYVVGVVAL